MTLSEKRFLILLFINLIIALIYLIVNIINKNSRSYITGFLVILTCPIVGVLFYGGAYIIYKIFFREPVDLEDVIFSKEKVKTIVGSEEDKERNMVSLEEAIAITNEHELRDLMMNIARTDIRKLLKSISLALDSEDTETSHYAASVLQDALNYFRMHVEKQRIIVMTDDDPDRFKIGQELIAYMDDVLVQNVFTDIEQNNFVKIMDEVGEVVFKGQPEIITSNDFKALSLRLLEIKEYEKAEKWCLRAKEYFPSVLATYSCMLKLYFTNENKEKFFETIEELKKSPIVVDRETLEMIRVFSE